MIHSIQKIKLLLVFLFCCIIYTAYSKPPEDSLLTHLNRNHPRLLANINDFDRIAKEKETDGYVKEAFQKLYQNGEAIIKEPVSEFVIPGGLRLLATSRKVVSRVSTLAFLYRTTKEKRFADRAWDELLAAPQFPNWNPKHFLDVGEMTYVFALGYDWLYDYNKKHEIRVAI